MFRRSRTLRQTVLLVFITSLFLVFVFLAKDTYDSQLKELLNEEESSQELIQSPPLPTIYVVTPTYKRTTQMADLTRLAQTLMLVPGIHWLVVEDSRNRSREVAELLDRSRLPHSHLCAETPPRMRSKRYGKGVSSRLEALSWLRKNGNHNGVIYFADDDNAYDIRVFEEMRWTRKISVWPVGLIGTLGISTPLVRNGTVVAFHDAFSRNRLYKLDMAGFAVNSDFWLSKPNATFPYKLGYLEDQFLRGLNVSLQDMEPKASNCTKVLVWHTRTQSSIVPSARNMQTVANYTNTNLPELYRIILPERTKRKYSV